MATEARFKDDYLLKRSYAGSARLNLQHYMWLDDVGGQLLHPSIPTENTKLKIADIGTGTGIWLLDLARQHPPPAQLDGLDIDLSQLPPSEWLPPNVNFRQHNVFEAPTDDLIEKYDIIHVRHLTLVIKDNDPSAVLRNLWRMLRPGGYLQWGEFDLSNRVAVSAQPDYSTKAMEGLQFRMKDFLHTPKATWPAELGAYFTNLGFKNVHVQGKWTDRTHVYFHQDVGLLVYEELIDLIALRPNITQKEVTELRGRLAEAAAESRRGAAWDVQKLTTVGQKPY